MRTLGVIDQIEDVDLSLQLLERVGEGLLIEEPEQGLVEAFVLALRGRLIGLARDRLDPQRGHIRDELAQHASTGRVQRSPVIAEQSLRNTVSLDPLPDNSDRRFRRLTPGHVRGDCEPRVIIDELEDDTLPTAREDILGRVELPACVRGRIDEPAKRCPRLLPRFDFRYSRVTEDPRQRRRRGHRRHPERPHLLVNTDRAVIQAGSL